MLLELYGGPDEVPKSFNVSEPYFTYSVVLKNGDVAKYKMWDWIWGIDTNHETTNKDHNGKFLGQKLLFCGIEPYYSS